MIYFAERTTWKPGETGFPAGLIRGALALSLLLGLGACGTSHPRLDDGIARLDSTPAHALPRRKNIWRRYRGDHMGNTPLDSIPVPDNPQVARWINYFTHQNRDQYLHYLRSGERFRLVVEKTLQENGVPPEIYYLGMIESGYRTRARSSEGAVGFWQFRKSTARSFGLQLDDYVDERRDPVRSTHAAARYLRRLRASFGDWYLAIAAYNAGDGRVRQAISEGGTRDFWELCQKKLLPRETRNYVPKFLAALTIGKSPGQYGFGLPVPSGRIFPDVEKVTVPSPVRLREVARAAGISYSEFRWINRHIKTTMTPPNGGVYQVWIPRTADERFQSSRKSLLAVYHTERADLLFR